MSAKRKAKPATKRRRSGDATYRKHAMEFIAAGADRCAAIAEQAGALARSEKDWRLAVQAMMREMLIEIRPVAQYARNVLEDDGQLSA